MPQHSRFGLLYLPLVRMLVVSIFKCSSVHPKRKKSPAIALSQPGFFLHRGIPFIHHCPPYAVNSANICKMQWDITIGSSAFRSMLMPCLRTSNCDFRKSYHPHIDAHLSCWERIGFIKKPNQQTSQTNGKNSHMYCTYGFNV